MALPKQHRLGSNREFSRVHRKGLRASTQHLAIRALSSRRQQKKRLPKLKGDVKGRKIIEESADSQLSALSCAKKPQKSSSEAIAKSPSKFGISISKKVSKRAVVRNRIKRQIKAVIHRHLPAIESGWQVVIVVRPSAVECEFADFLRELEYLLKKLKITDAEATDP